MKRSRIPVKDFAQFQNELAKLGANDSERAQVLGVNNKTVERLRCSLPSTLAPLLRYPQLLQAILNDLKTNTIE